MRKTFFLFCLSVSSYGFSQPVKQVINAEKRFAAYAIQHNTKEAFLTFMDSAAVVFQNGQMLQAKKVWTANPVSSNRLIWEPAFAGISRSGDLGFTTGPWQIKPAGKDSVIATGEFATIWKKNKSGEWRFLVDMGVPFPQPGYQVSKVAHADFGRKSNADQALPMLMESTINSLYSQSGTAGLISETASNAWYIITGHQPLKGIQDIRQQAERLLPASIEFTPITGGIASSGDLAYTYGNTKYNGRQGNYLRVWLHTADGWKIVLQVMT